MKILLIATLLLSGCGGGLVETVTLNAGSSLVSNLLIDKMKGNEGCNGEIN